MRWHAAGEGAVLATVIETWGSAPRRVGAQLAISGAGDMVGSVSGGCVEGAVVVEALEALETGAARVLEYGVSDADAFAVGLACGGTIRVLVDPVGSAMPADILQALVAKRAARVPVACVADLETGARSLESTGHDARMRADRSGFDAENPSRFIAVHNAPLRLVVVGAVHIAQALVPMARLAGYDPFVIDPRAAFASPARFPDTSLSHDWPDAAVDAIGLDARTGLVLLTHDPKLDDPALVLGLRSEAFYIGALGSTRTHAKRVARLQEAGFSDAEIGRIHAPVGLDIGSVNPAEIAVSILAQMTKVLRKTGAD